MASTSMLNYSSSHARGNSALFLSTKYHEMSKNQHSGPTAPRYYTGSKKPGTDRISAMAGENFSKMRRLSNFKCAKELQFLVGPHNHKYFIND